MPAGPPGLATRSDREGNFVIPNLLAQPHRLTVESRVHGRLVLEPVAAGQGELDILMPSGLAIRGRVLSDGLPYSADEIESVMAEGR